MRFVYFCILFSASVLFAQEENVELSWHTEEAAAKEDAQKQGKPILYMFTADWCHFCKTMEKETLNKPKVSQYLDKNFVLLLVDYDTNKDLVARYGVTGVPAMLITDPQVKKVEQTAGFMPIDVFLAWAEMSAINVSTDAIAAEEKAAEQLAEQLSKRFRKGLTDDQYAAINEFYEDFARDDPSAVAFAESHLADEIKHNPGRFARFLKNEKLHIRILTTNMFAEIYGADFNYDPWDMSPDNYKNLDVFLKEKGISSLLEDLMRF